MNKLEFIQTIRQLIADGKTDEALTLMRTQVSNFDTSLITDATMLESRYTTVFKDFTSKGILPREDYDRTIAQINYALLEIVEKLEKSAPLSTSTAKNKNSGRILHNIPGIMPVGKERRCIVRIAYDDETLLRDLKVDENTTIQSVRIAEVMGVELVDFNETPAFTIRTITEEEQFISSDDYTQWLFMVKALREGKFPLTLKVAVIEEVNGKERKRDIVLEKEIFIISNIEEPVPSAAPAAPVSVKDVPPQPVTHFEDSSIRFNYVVNDEKSAAAASSTSSKRFSISGLMSTVGVIVMAMVGWVTFQTFNRSSETPNIVLNKDKEESNGSNKNNSSDTIIALPNNPSNKNSQIAETEHKNDVKKDNPKVQANYPVHAVESKDDAKQGTTLPPIQNDKSKDKPAAYEVPNKKVTVPIKTGTKPQVIVPTNPKSVKTTTTKPPIQKPKRPVVSPKITSTTVTEPKIKIGDVKIVPPSTATSSVTEKEAEIKTYRVRLVLKGEMKKAEISVDGQSVDQFLKKNIWGTPQYIEFKSSKERHTITFSRGGVSCSVTDVLIENGDLSVEPCSFEK